MTNKATSVEDGAARQRRETTSGRVSSEIGVAATAAANFSATVDPAQPRRGGESAPAESIDDRQSTVERQRTASRTTADAGDALKQALEQQLLVERRERKVKSWHRILL